MLNAPFACLITSAGGGSEPDDTDADRRHCEFDMRANLYEAASCTMNCGLYYLI